MKCTIVANGNILNYSYYSKIIKNTDYIICVDGGAKHLVRMNITPRVIIGDLDSIDEKTKEFFLKKKVEFLKFPRNKNATDTELALDFAMSLNPSEVVLLGVIGNRMDHSIGNITLLKKLLDKGIKGRVINESNEIYILNSRINELSLTGGEKDYISLIPLSYKVKGINLEGLKYPLIDAEIPLGSSIGISNEFIKNRAKVRIKEGLLLVMKARD